LSRHASIILAADIGIDGNQVIAPAHLYAVTGEIEQAERLALQLVAELAQCQVHVLERRVLAMHDLEAGLLQEQSHIGGIVGRIGQRHALVGAVADHQRNARRLARRIRRLCHRRNLRMGDDNTCSE
jgi:hypothetical protein